MRYQLIRSHRFYFKMAHFFRRIAYLIFFAAAFLNCHKKTANQTEQSILQPLAVLPEIEVWKQELISQKLLGSPCRFESSFEESAAQWAEENPGRLDGFPASPEDIGVVKTDFDENGKEDILLYFRSENCTGHNGGSPYFAKIIYDDGSEDDELMDDIRQAILIEYGHFVQTNPNLKEVTSSYLEETVTLSYEDGNIGGTFKLYAADDAHCCPSYTGYYTYHVAEGDAYINIESL